MIDQLLRSDRLTGALAVALTIAGFALAIAVSSAPQAYDADTYLEEATNLVVGAPDSVGRTTTRMQRPSRSPEHRIA